MGARRQGGMAETSWRDGTSETSERRHGARVGRDIVQVVPTGRCLAWPLLHVRCTSARGSARSLAGLALGLRWA